MKSLPQYWSDAFLWLTYALLGVVGAVGVSIIVLLAMKVGLSIGGFTDGGQFALYSAGMWGTMYYVIARPTSLRLPFTEWFALPLYLGIVLSVTLFVLAVLYSNGSDIDPAFVRWPTIALFAFSAGVTTIAIAYDNRRMELNLPERRRSERQALDESFDRTEKGGD